jgi:hypothetical protein
VFGHRCFDPSKPIVPASWVGTADLPFLSPDAQRILNHARAFSYPHLFGNYEEFIPISLGQIAEQCWHGDRMRLRALMRFGEEEIKHQQLFLRAETVMEDSCGHSFGRYFDPAKERVTAFTAALLQYPLLPRFMLLTAFEWGSQRHYVDSVRDCDGDQSDPLYVDILKCHWLEENQHTKTDVLEIAQLATALSADALVAVFDQLGCLIELVDETFVGQVEQEMQTFETVCGRALAGSERTILRDRLLATMRAIWGEVGLTHPSFKKVVRELSPEGAAKLGIA